MNSYELREYIKLQNPQLSAAGNTLVGNIVRYVDAQGFTDDDESLDLLSSLLYGLNIDRNEMARIAFDL